MKSLSLLWNELEKVQAELALIDEMEKEGKSVNEIYNFIFSLEEGEDD